MLYVLLGLVQLAADKVPLLPIDPFVDLIIMFAVVELTGVEWVSAQRVDSWLTNVATLCGVQKVHAKIVRKVAEKR